MRPKHQGNSHTTDNTGDPFYGLVYTLVFIFDGTVIFWRVSSSCRLIIFNTRFEKLQICIRKP